MIHIGEEGAQKTHAPDLQGNTKPIVIAPAFPDKFFIRFIKMKIACQLKLIRFASEPAIAFSLLSGQKINGHIGLPA
ncbi:hypothetical protein TH59_07155 [Pantoea ananatis]|nr:hypothetical protein [Pantoea ananatis]